MLNSVGSKSWRIFPIPGSMTQATNLAEKSPVPSVSVTAALQLVPRCSWVTRIPLLDL